MWRPLAMVTSRLFQTCCKVLSQSEQIGEEGGEARAFLSLLGYLPTHRPYEPGSDVFQNRLALLELASRFDDAFRLPMRHAPGAEFFGALVRPAAFDIPGYEERKAEEAGKGAVGVGGRGETLGEAFESCVGEAAEYLSFIEREHDPLLVQWNGSHNLERRQLGWALAGIGLPEDTDPARLDWVEAVSLLDGSCVLFPAELVLRRVGKQRMGRRQAESNGLGAGRTRADAILSGLTEVIERDAVALWWYGGAPARSIGPGAFKSCGFDHFTDRIRGGTARQFWMLDLTSDVGIPVVAALSAEPDGAGVIAGFGAHPDMLLAMRRAFLEMCQMELAQEISLAKLRNCAPDTLKPQDIAWIDKYRNLSCENFPQLRPPETQVHEIDQCVCDNAVERGLKALQKIKITPYAVNLYRDEIRVRVVRIIAPGLQSSSPDWFGNRLKRTGNTDLGTEKIVPII